MAGIAGIAGMAGKWSRGVAVYIGHANQQETSRQGWPWCWFTLVPPGGWAGGAGAETTGLGEGCVAADLQEVISPPPLALSGQGQGLQGAGWGDGMPLLHSTAEPGVGLRDEPPPARNWSAPFPSTMQ